MNANTVPVSGLPTTIPEYLAQLRAALKGADPAMIQDALYDAEEYLRSEMAEQPGRPEAEVIAAVAGSYGAPEEVAEIYRDTEVKVQTALRPPTPPQRRSALGRFFGVAADARTYGALFYMLLAVATGIFYFTWVVTGFSVSLGLSITIVGIPLLILFFGSVRVLSLVEGRIVEVMLGERMPRRPLYSVRGRTVWQRIGDMFTDPRTWSTLLYMLLMLPLGIAYFTLAVTLLSVSLTLLITPLALLPGIELDVWLAGIDVATDAPWLLPLLSVLGILLLFVTLHVARGIGYLHGQLAKHLLVKGSQHA
ncbi:sensor domain-containing protein [Marilutibacter chinensis]|uniref:Sensor domain-containing protein n=1 Tax=Marilutibacter chinensis TaxID=2912247 RepID=A0ABS9HXK7_9GAMM|nr:sensor domain-containing protein [Lysobacter chinensis]MCF7221191.1 sensor domain-containing protein [Lysobacter chinensis]MCF7223068.1 sensor domain-containing protein [Lysobacter chinensis]